MTKNHIIPHSERLCNECTDGICFVQNQCSEEWQKILGQFKTVQAYSAGEIICTKGEHAKGIYIVYSGIVKLVDNAEEPNFIATIVQQGGLFGYRSFGQKESALLYSAVAMTDCELSFFPMDIFQSAVRANSELSFYLIDQLSQSLYNAEQVAMKLAHSSAKARVFYAADTLMKALEKANKSEDGYYAVSRRDISNIAQTSYETVIRSLHDLHKNGDIELKGKSIKIKR